MYFLFKLLFCGCSYWVYGWNTFTAPIKWTLCLCDKITLGVPRTPWCLFIYRSVFREYCRSSRKAMRHAVCHYAWKAVIAAPLWIKTFQINWNLQGSSSHCIFKLIRMLFILNIESMKQKDLLWFNKNKTGQIFWRLFRILKAWLCWCPLSRCSSGPLILPRKWYTLDLILASGRRVAPEMSLLVGTEMLLPYLSPVFSKNQWVSCHFRSFKLQNDYGVLKLSAKISCCLLPQLRSYTKWAREKFNLMSQMCTKLYKPSVIIPLLPLKIFKYKIFKWFFKIII